MNRFKLFVLRLMLVVVTVWPAVHIALVRIYDVNPWKLAGWGMYSAPQLPVRVEITALTPDEIGRYELRSVQPAFEPELERFLVGRRNLGRLVEPDALARALLEHYPAIDGVEIRVVRTILNTATARIEERSSSFAYKR